MLEIRWPAAQRLHAPFASARRLKRAHHCCPALLPPQAALQAAQQAGGGVIFLPAGTYVLSRPLVITRSNVVLRGEGQGLTTIHIPVSLSDVYQGTWSLANNGE